MEHIEGLPEGVQLVRLGAAGPDDWELVDNRIYKGPRVGASSQVIIQPAPGFTFVRDIREHASYVVARKHDYGKRMVVVFEVSNSLAESAVRDLSSMEGFVSLEE